MIEDGTGIRHHAKAFGDVGTVIPPIILYLKAVTLTNISHLSTEGIRGGVLFLL